MAILNRINKNILGIIPARAGSKRVKNKNFRPFAESTLTDLAIQQALSSELLDAILVTSDSAEVLKIAERYEDIIPLERPEPLSTDFSPAIDYQKHALDYLKKEFNETFDWVTIIQPSSPLRCGEDIDATIELFEQHPDADSSVSVVQLQHMVHPYKLKILDSDRLLPFIIDEHEKIAANDLPEIHVRNCAVYVFKTSNIYKNIQLGDYSVGYVMPQTTSVDINTMIDFEFAEYLYRKLKTNED
jgi:CMP-N,N'-diacetyllegionaminic acid synthase